MEPQKFLKHIKGIARMVWIVIVIVIVLVAAAAAYVYLVKPPAREGILIGAGVSLTGRFARAGQDFRLAYELWAEQVNEKGGLLGEPVKLRIYDDKSETETVISVYERLIDVDKVDLLLCPYSSVLMFAVGPTIERSGIPVIDPLGSTAMLFKEDYKYLFNLIHVPESYQQPYFEMLNATTPETDRTVAVVSASDVFGESMATGTVYWAEYYGFEVVIHEKFTPGTVDLTPIINKVKPFDPDHFLGIGYLPDSISMLRAVKEMDFNPKSYYFAVGPAQPEYIQTLEEDAYYAFSLTQWEAFLPYPGAKEFAELWNSKYSYVPDYHPATAYASAIVLEEAINTTGSFDTEKILEAIQDMDIMTFFGRVKFRLVPNYGPIGADLYNINDARPCVFITQTDGNGTLQIVWPLDVASAEIIYPLPSWSER